MSQKSLGIIALLSVLAACTEEKVEYFDCAVCDKDFAGEDTGLDVTEDGAEQLLPAGSACTLNDECQTGSCFCGETVTEECFDLKATAEGMGAQWPYVMTGGMCSKLFCNPKKADGCGDGGFCFDVAPLFNVSMEIGLCLKYCEEYYDCRYTEGYVCYYTGIEGQRACLPADLVAEIPCGNGVCDNNETVETCPRDCQ